MKFVHLADVHLGAVPDRGYPWSQAREEEIWESFRRVITGIRENPVDFLFISGDLFHRQPLARELKEVNYLFSTIPQTRVYLIAGNHDYLKKDSPFDRFEWESNVFFFKEEELQCVKDSESDVYIYGLSYQHQEIAEPLYQNAGPNHAEGYHILLAHGGDEKHIPINFRTLSSAGFDYIALGHIHKPQEIIPDKIYYSGALEPLDRNDVGIHGYVEGSMLDGKVQAEFVPFAVCCYQDIRITLDEEYTQIKLEEIIKNKIRNHGRQHIYRIFLDGFRAPDFMFLTERLKNLGNVIEVIDHTQLAYDLDALYHRYYGTLIGDYINHFRDAKPDSIEAKALYYGLQALLETSR
ncbi:MAG: DNA repair exonuclease [Eubacteriales bacterium]|nr:DNA repair exonuclease [Eubacteriales bacterium]